MKDFLRKYSAVLITIALICILALLGFSGIFKNEINTSEDTLVEAEANSTSAAITEVPKPATVITTTKVSETAVTESTEIKTEESKEFVSEISTISAPESTVLTTVIETTTVTTTAVTSEIVTSTTKKEVSDVPDIEYDNSCSFVISCENLLTKIDRLDKNKRQLVPQDGIIFRSAHVGFNSGESVFDLLRRICTSNSIAIDSTVSPAVQSVYVKGIANLYEKDAGLNSGWMYKVNGELPMIACSEYILNNNDKVEFVYTCDYGDV